MYVYKDKYSYAREISWCWNVVPLTLWLSEHLVLCGRWLWQYPRWGRAESDPHMSRWTHQDSSSGRLTGLEIAMLSRWLLLTSLTSLLSPRITFSALPQYRDPGQVPAPTQPPSLPPSPSSKHQFTSWNISVFSLRWVWWDRSDADICQDNLYFDHHDLWDVSS